MSRTSMEQARQESLRRRIFVIECRARKAGWKAVRALAREPGAWAEQVGEILVCLFKLSCSILAHIIFLLLLWGWVSDTALNELSPLVIDTTTTLGVILTLLHVAIDAAAGHLPLSSPFAAAWQRAYADATRRAYVKRHQRAREAAPTAVDMKG